VQCRKDDDVTGIPYVEVNFTININDPEYIKLTTIGNWEYVTGGSRGIVIYRLSENEFVAFDRHCTYDPSAVCSQLDVDATGLRLNDYDCCGSEYSLINGTVLKGPSTLGMKRYTTSFDGINLIVTN
jgi:nitrite reductase/ring-hydroxylating ferredoxin subunit